MTLFGFILLLAQFVRKLNGALHKAHVFVFGMIWNLFSSAYAGFSKLFKNLYYIFLSYYIDIV